MLRYYIKKGLIVVSFIFSLNFFQACFAFGYSTMMLTAAAGVGVGAVGLIGSMFASVVSSVSSVHEEGDTTIALYENVSGTLVPIPSDQDIILKSAPATQTFVYKNIGSSDWLNPSVSWFIKFDGQFNEVGGSEYYVALTENTCNSRSSLASGESCSFNLVTKHNHPGDWGTIQVSGDNLLGGTQFKNVLAGGGLTITINFDPLAYHLGYRSIKLTNTIPNGGIHISSITPNENLLAGTDPVVKYCPPGDSSCVYTTTCNLSAPSKTTSLASGASCLVWFKANSKKANNITDIPLQTIPATTGRIKVTIEAEKQTQGIWEPISEDEKDSTFKSTYNNSLYAGGAFITATNAGGGVTVNRIAKWDGSNWSALISGASVGVSDLVLALTNLNGDLYVGGTFSSSPGSGIVKWNGSNWQELGSGVNSAVTTLTWIDNNLYAGGTFTIAGGVSANHIAKWDGLNWSALGSPTVNGTDGAVYALTNIGNNLYVGGDFITAGGVTVNNLAKWDGANWLSIGFMIIGADNVVRALTVIGTDFYIGGGFNSPGSKVAKCDSIANGCMWLGFTITGGYVYSLATMGDVLYVGGAFTSPAPKILKWNNGTGWLPLGSGIDNNFVYSVITMSTNTGTDVYTGGSFTTAGGGVLNTSRIARWDGSSWLPLSSGMDDTVRTLLVAPALSVTDYAWPGQ